jgi:hypothetical protein
LVLEKFRISPLSSGLDLRTLRDGDWKTVHILTSVTPSSSLEANIWGSRVGGRLLRGRDLFPYFGAHQEVIECYFPPLQSHPDPENDTLTFYTHFVIKTVKFDFKRQVK